MSHNFFNKNWPKIELNSLLSREITNSERVILPVWHNLTRDEVSEYSLILADRYAVQTSMGIDKVVEKIIQDTFGDPVEPEYCVYELHDMSHIAAKRYSVTILVDKEYTTEQIKRVILLATEEFKNSQYYRNEKSKKRWGNIDYF